MIPNSFSDERVTVFVEYLPAMQVGGDYACIRSVSEDRLYIIIADVSGHGVTSSLVMSRVSAEIERLAQIGEDVAAIGEILNNLMKSILGEELLYLTLFGAAIDFSDQTMTYVNCGHPAQLLWSHKDRKYVRLESQNMPVGLFGPEVFGTPQKSIVEMRGGDKLLLFTDGFLELERENGSELGESGLMQIFQELIEMPTEETERQVFERINAWQEAHPHDDVLFIFAGLK